MTPEQRIETFRQAVEQRPDEPFARYSLAMSYRAAGRVDEALREFEELVRRNPRYVPTYLMLGQVLVGLGRAADAARAYERGIEAAVGPNDEHARSELRKALDTLQALGRE